MFLAKYEATETERAQLYEDLLAHQTAALRDREAEHTRHLMEMEQATTDFTKKIDQLLAKPDAYVKSINTSFEIITAKLQLKVAEA